MNDPDTAFREPTLGLLRTRASTPLPDLCEPGPSADQLDALLDAALRVPDHGRLRPWRIHVVQGEYRATLATQIAQIYRREVPVVDDVKLAKLARMPVAAPLLLVVTGRITRGHRIPEIEQVLSGGALCQNLLLAAHALGFGGYWLTGWAASNPTVKALFELAPEDPILGFIAVGSRRRPPPAERRYGAPVAEVAQPWRGVDAAD